MMINRVLTRMSMAAAAMAVSLFADAAPIATDTDFSIRLVSSDAAFAGRHMSGIAIDPANGDIYVAVDDIHESTFSFDNAFDLYRVDPVTGFASLVGSYPIEHFELVELEWGPDGRIYTIDRLTLQVHAIDPQTGSSSVYATSSVFVGRYSLEFDAAGDLLLIPEGVPNPVYRVAPTGTTFVGSYTLTNFEHGDRAGIQPDGDIIVYPDGGGFMFELSTAGHVDGTNFPKRFMTSNYRGAGDLGIAIGYSTGAIDPETGDIYATSGNFGRGACRITRTPGDVGPTATTTIFVDQIGNNICTTTSSARGVTDLDFGPRSDGFAGNSLYFLDNFTKTVHEVVFPLEIPTADAGPDQTVPEGSVVTLDGSASSDPANLTLDYAWTRIAGPVVSLSDATVVNPTFTAPVTGADVTITFELVVTNADGAVSEADTVDILVQSVNDPPVADAGDDFSIKPGAVATLDGSNSFDADNATTDLSYSWTQDSGTAVTLSGATTVTPTFSVPFAVGDVLMFSLVVSDPLESSAPDQVQVTIVENAPPLADAGSDQTKDEGEAVTLDGSASSDPDGDTLSFAWTQLLGTAVSLSDSTSPTPSFTAPAVSSGGEALVFELTVTDSDPFTPKSHTDEVTINVRNINDPPSCDLAVASVKRIWPPNHKMTEVSIDGVMDDDSIYNLITLSITGVTQDEPIDGTGDGDTSPDGIIQTSTPADKVLLRGERAGGGNGRVYAVAFEASDGFEECTGAVHVTVPHDRKGPDAVNDGQTVDSTLP